jgi:hypothetical protein
MTEYHTMWNCMGEVMEYKWSVLGVVEYPWHLQTVLQAMLQMIA